MKKARKILFLILSIITVFCLSMSIGCSCNNKDEENKEGTACVHEWGEWISNGDGTHKRVCKKDSTHIDTGNCTISASVSPTCTSVGYTDYNCICGYNAHVTESALGHKWDKDVSCEEGHVCTREGCFASDPALKHDYIVQEIIPVSCEENGRTVYKCKNCDDTYEAITEYSTGHDFKGVVWGEPTEIEVDGCIHTYSRNGQCPKCSEELTDIYSVSKHNFTNIEITTPATCKSEGIKTLTCKDCGAEVTEKYTDENAHVWGTAREEGGYKIYDCTCEGCDATKKELDYSNVKTAEVEKDALSGSELKLETASIALDQATLGGLGDSVEITAETVDKNSLSEEIKNQIGDKPVYDFSMQSDGSPVSNFDGKVTIRVPYELEEGEDPDSIAILYINDQGEIEKIKAKYINGEAEFETNHFSYYTVTRLTPAERCALYDHIITETEVKPTCTTQGYKITVCTRCGKYEKVYTPALGHDFEEIDRKDASCTKNGEIIYKCTHENCNVERKEVILATGHNFELIDSQDSTCAVEGFRKYKCTKCEEEKYEILKLARHTFTEEVVEPTDTEDGYTLHKCANCTYSYKDNFVSKTEKADIAKSAVITPVFESIFEKDLAFKFNNFNMKVKVDGEGEVEINVNELQFKLDIADDGTINGYATADIEGNEAIFDEMDPIPVSIKADAIIENNVAYVQLNMDMISRGYDYRSFGYLARALVENQTVYVKIDLNTIDFCEDSLPFTNYSELVDFVKEIKGVYDEKIADVISDYKFLEKQNYYRFTETLFGWFFRVSKTTNGYILTCDADKIVDTINMFNTKSISAIIDSLFGDGSFDDIASFIESVPDKTMGDVIDWLEDNGITVDLVEEVLEELLPEDIFGTIPFDEIRQTLEDEDFLKSTIKDMIIEMGVSEEYFDSGIANITDALESIKESTLFELIENISIGGNDASERVEFYSELEDEEEPDFDICSMLVSLFEDIDFSININANDKKEIISVDFSGSADIDSVSVSLDFDFDFEPNYDFTSSLSEIKEIFDKVAVKDIIKEYAEEYGAEYDETTNTMIYTTNYDNRYPYITLISEDGEEIRIYKKQYVSKVYFDSMMIALLKGCGDEYEISANVLYEGRYIYSAYKKMGDGEKELTYNELTKLFSEEELEAYDIYGDDEHIFGSTRKGYDSSTGSIVYDIVTKEVRFDRYHYESEHDFKEEIIKEAVGCTGVGEIKYTCKDCGYTETKYYINGHDEIIYTYELHGESCSDGVTWIARCEDCGYEVERFETTNHQRHRVKKFDVSTKDEVCGVYIEMCACVRDGDIYTYGSCIREEDFEIDKEYGEYGWIYYFGNGRSLLLTEEDIPIEGEVCKLKVVIRVYYDYNVDDETYSKKDQYELTVYDHEIRTFVSLQEGATTCEDGVLITEKCTKCGKTISERKENYHYRGLLNVIDLSEHVSTCDGEIFVYGCPCGANSSYYEVNSYRNIRYYTSGDIYTFNDGTNVYITYTEMPVENEPCKVRKIYTAYIGYNTDNGSYSKSVPLYDVVVSNHNIYQYVKLVDGATTCEDGVLVTRKCLKCGETIDEYTVHYHFYGVVEEYNLKDYGAKCDGRILYYNCPCGEYSGSPFAYVGDCDFDCYCIYYHSSYDNLYVYTCSVTNPACGFRYAIKTYTITDKTEDDCCSVYVSLILNCDADGENGITFEPLYKGENHITEWHYEGKDDGDCVCDYVCTCTVCGKEIDRYECSDHAYGEEVTMQGENLCEIIHLRTCSRCQKKDIIYYEYNHSYGEIQTQEYSDCYVEYYHVCEYCGCKSTFNHGYLHDYEIVFPTCTQFGVATCKKCGDTETIDPVCHEWEYDQETELYYCIYCGLENANGASGEIVLEDLSYLSDDSDTVIIGYYLRNYGYDSQDYSNSFTVNLSLIKKGDENADPIVLSLGVTDGLDKYGYNCVYFSMADAKVEAEGKGYSLDDYDVRISFVPLGGLGSNLDYAITIAEDRVVNKVIMPEIIYGVATKDDCSCGNYRDMKEFEITLEKESVVTFTSFSNNDTVGQISSIIDTIVYDDDDSGFNNNFFIKAKLPAGTYRLEVGNYYINDTTSIPYAYSIA